MNIALFGAAGYGKTYLDLIEYAKKYGHVLCAVVDPFANQSDFSVSVFSDENALFESKIHIDLAVITSPIYCHFRQAKACIEHGINVLCEKPVCADVQSAETLEKYAAQNGVLLGVGFQLSWCDNILRLKKDISNGRFGKPLAFKCLLSWRRPASYYSDSSWKGRITDQNGNLVNDSVIFNATSHYLHNIFFVSGSDVADYGYFTARANDIESFDTCVIKGKLKNGASLWFGATHCGDEYIEPIFEYRFENATVYYNQNNEDRMFAVMNDGSVADYGKLQGSGQDAQKLLKMLNAQTSADVMCSISDCMPHLKICSEITGGRKPLEFSEKTLISDIVTVPDLCSKMRLWYGKELLPDL
ncbi:MAG: Gfo/Idh/MocA family oxidoreductase [Ruminococcaceae bacterium]|nr:Gfo/Idh/MocA family oxidoreductase [Oscillospiraceae bacterium]